MTADELQKKYPSHAKTIRFEPKSDCKFCHGTGERHTRHPDFPDYPCYCLYFSHEYSDELGAALSQWAGKMRREMEEDSE